MKLYNSLTKQIEDFVPIEQGKVRMYSCGPTVYNNLHIGNLSAFIYADLLRRTLAASGYEVQAVMNITDVDDKTIRDSKREYPELDPMQALQNLTQKYERVFLGDIKRIGVQTDAITFIRATETIQEMIGLTQTLLEQGFAYPAEDGIYFSIKNYEEAGFSYGQLQQIDRSHEHARVANDEYDKDSASDFALWKAAGDGEPSWDALFTHQDREIKMPGRPGWHIECSAMSDKLLGTPFDIHTGGIDLKFPHHENEIAQSCAASTQHTFARVFVHNNHILVDGRKMSKSLGNVTTLREIEDKGFDPQAFRLLVLSSHYRSESNFSWDILDAAQNRLKRWQSLADLRWQSTEGQGGLDADKSMLTYLQNDLDTPGLLSKLDEFFTHLQRQNAAPTAETLAFIRDIIGIDLIKDDVNDEIKILIKNRMDAKQEQNWDAADAIKDQLWAKGIEIRDTPHGTIWNRL